MLNKISYQIFLLKILFAVLAALWKYMLELFYLLFSKDFGYYGIIYAPRDWQQSTLAYLSVILLSLLIPVKISRPSTLILVLLFLFCYIPIATVFSVNEFHPSIAFYGLTLSFAIMLLLQFVSPFQENNKSSYFSLDIMQPVVIAFFAFSFLSVTAYYGFSLKWVNFSEVYDTRAEYAEQSNRLVGYLYGWLSHVVNIAILLFAVNRKKYALAVVALLIQVYLYTLGGHKSVLLIIPFVFWVWLGTKYFQKYLSLYLLLTLFTITLVLLISDASVAQYSNASSIFIRRNLLLPAQIHFHFVEYFSANYPDYFAQNFPFSIFYESKYDDKLPSIIGKTYFTFKEGIYANGNIFADLFANLGNISFIAGALILSLILKALDYAAKDRNALFVLPLTAVSIVTLSNSGLIVNLVTHGIIVMIVLIRFYPKNIFYLKFFKK
jgi:hypothetical protein